jgi:hypothetical protein
MRLYTWARATYDENTTGETGFSVIAVIVGASFVLGLLALRRKEWRSVFLGHSRQQDRAHTTAMAEKLRSFLVQDE